MCEMISAMKLIAEVVKLVDALASGASERKLVEVQVLSSAPYYRCQVVTSDNKTRKLKGLAGFFMPKHRLKLTPTELMGPRLFYPRL